MAIGNPDIGRIVERANALMASDMGAMEALAALAPEYGINAATLYQRIRLAGGRLEKRFVLPASCNCSRQQCG